MKNKVNINCKLKNRADLVSGPYLALKNINFSQTYLLELQDENINSNHKVVRLRANVPETHVHTHTHVYLEWGWQMWNKNKESCSDEFTKHISEIVS